MLTLLLMVFVASGPGGGGLLERGLVALQQGHLADARKDLEQASRAEPKNPYVWSSLAETYLRLKLHTQASAAADAAEKNGADNPIVWHALAMFYSEFDQPGRAAKFEQRFAQSPKADGGAFSRSASLYLQAGEAQQAVAAAREASARIHSPVNEDLLGRALFAAGQTAAAEKALNSAWEQAKADPHISFDYAQALLHREDFMRAAEVIDSALASHPQDSQLTLALGVARYGQRRFEEALTAFLAVIKLDATVEQPYLFIGRMLDQAGSHLAEIQAAYEAWAARNPQNAKAQLLLAKVLLVADHNSDRIENLLRRSVTLDGGNWETHYELGVLLEDKHDYLGAAGELSRGSELNPKEPMLHYHLARVYNRLGQPAKAEAERELHQQLTAPKAP